MICENEESPQGPVVGGEICEEERPESSFRIYRRSCPEQNKKYPRFAHNRNVEAFRYRRRQPVKVKGKRACHDRTLAIAHIPHCLSALWCEKTYNRLSWRSRDPAIGTNGAHATPLHLRLSTASERKNTERDASLPAGSRGPETSSRRTKYDIIFC